MRRGNQSSLAPAALTIFAQWARSVLICAANSSGVFPTGSIPSLSRRSRKSGRLMTATESSWIFFTISRGAPAGAMKPYQAVMSKPGRVPATAGTFGSGFSLVGPVTASVFDFPLLVSSTGGGYRLRAVIGDSGRVGAGAVLHHPRLVPDLLKLGRHDAPVDGGRAAGREGDDDPDGFARIALSPRGRRKNRQSGERNCYSQRHLKNLLRTTPRRISPVHHPGASRHPSSMRRGKRHHPARWRGRLSSREAGKTTT